MLATQRHLGRGMTLVEIVLVMALLVAITAVAVPAFVREYEQKQLDESARRLEALLTMTRAQAGWEGKRYRIRFPDPEQEEDLDALGTQQQPRVECEADPLEEPEVWTLVTAPWAVGQTLVGKVHCLEVRLEKPTLEQIRQSRERRDAIDDLFVEKLLDYNPRWPPLYIEPDGTSEWATFVLAEAEADIELDELAQRIELDDDDHLEVIELIVEGETGQAWRQRPLYEEELDLFEEHNWPVVQRKDFRRRAVLTEDDVLELREERALRALEQGS